MPEPVNLNRGTMLGNGAQGQGPVVMVQPTEMVLINGEPTGILSALFIMLADIRDTLHRIEAMSPEPEPEADPVG